MSAEACRKIKAILLMTMLAAAEAQQMDARVSQATKAGLENQEQAGPLAKQAQAMMAGPAFQEQAKLLSNQVETIMADPSFQEHVKRVAEQMEAMRVDPHFQAQAKRLAEPIQELFADPKFQEQAKHMTEKMDAVKADPQFQEQAARIAKQMEEVIAEPLSHEQVQRLAEQVNAIMADPALQEQAKRYFAEPMEAVSANPAFQEQAKRASEQMQAILADTKLQEQARDLAEQMQAMWEDTNLQEQTKLYAEQMADPEDREEDSMDAAVDNLVDQLYSRTPRASPLRTKGLDETALGKSAQLASPTSHGSKHIVVPTRPRSRSSYSHTGSFHTPRASVVASRSTSSRAALDAFGLAPRAPKLIAQRHRREPSSPGLPLNRREGASSRDVAAAGLTAAMFTETIAPTLGTIIANGMFFSNVPAITEAREKKTLGELNPIPFAMILANCASWLAYGFLSANPYVWGSNAPGLLLGLFMTVTGIRLADEETKGKMEAVLLTTMAIILAASSYSAFFLTTNAARMALAGWVANGILVIYYASPLSTLAKVIKEKSSASLYPPLSALSLVNGMLWVSYGLAVKDLFIAVPNGIGVVLATVQLGFCFAFPGAFGSKEKAA